MGLSTMDSPFHLEITDYRRVRVIGSFDGFSHTRMNTEFLKIWRHPWDAAHRHKHGS